MITIYNLKTPELLDQHFESLTPLLFGSPHASPFKGIAISDIKLKLLELCNNDGLILKASYGQAAAGILIAEVQNSNEFGVLEFWLDPDAEDRMIDLLFDQCRREVIQRSFRAIYCNHTWFESIENPKIRAKFLSEKK
jgi:hypothetical protein